jgi:hypothetical protein
VLSDYSWGSGSVIAGRKLIPLLEWRSPLKESVFQKRKGSMLADFQNDCLLPKNSSITPAFKEERVRGWETFKKALVVVAVQEDGNGIEQDLKALQEITIEDRGKILAIRSE